MRMHMSYWQTTSEQEAESQIEAEKEKQKTVDLKKGLYDFFVWKAEEGITANGNKKITLTLKVTVSGGAVVFSEERLVDHPKMFYKRRHFWESVGDPESVNAEPYAYLK